MELKGSRRQQGVQPGGPFDRAGGSEMNLGGCHTLTKSTLNVPKGDLTIRADDACAANR